MKAVETSDQPRKTVSVFAVGIAPQRKEVSVVSFISPKLPKQKNNNRYPSLPLEDPKEIKNLSPMESTERPSASESSSSSSISPEFITSPGRCSLPLTSQAEAKPVPA